MDEINNLAIKIKLIMKWNTKYKICFNNVNQFNNFINILFSLQTIEFC